MRGERCATSSRCRQPLAFTVVIGSWPSVVCEKHLGLLSTRLLTVASGDSLTVKAYTPLAAAVASWGGR